MSTKQTLRITISQDNRSRDNDDFVMLEQEPWDPYVGRLTKMGAYGFLNKLLFEGPDVEPNCGYDGGRFGKQIYTYPSRPELNYRIGCSWGTLGPRRVQNLEFAEDVQINLELEVSTKYPPVSISRYEFIGDPYSEEGSVADRPIITVGSDNNIRLSKKVYGTLLVTYKVCRHTYSIVITPRVGALENKLQSFVYAVWDGGNTYIEVDAPDGAEEGECNNFGSGGDHFTSGDQPPSSVPANDIYINIDYCTQEEI